MDEVVNVRYYVEEKNDKEMSVLYESFTTTRDDDARNTENELDD